MSQLLHWAPSPTYPSRGSGLLSRAAHPRRKKRRKTLVSSHYKIWVRVFSIAVILNIDLIIALYCVHVYTVYLYLCVYVSVHVHAYACLWRSGDNFHRLVLSFHYVHPRGWSQVAGLAASPLTCSAISPVIQSNYKDSNLIPDGPTFRTWSHLKVSPSWHHCIGSRWQCRKLGGHSSSQEHRNNG